MSIKIYIIFWVSALGSVSEFSRSLLFRPFCNRFGNQEALCSRGPLRGIPDCPGAAPAGEQGAHTLAAGPSWGAQGVHRDVEWGSSTRSDGWHGCASLHGWLLSQPPAAPALPAQLGSAGTSPRPSGLTPLPVLHQAPARAGTLLRGPAAGAERAAPASPLFS